MKLTGAVTILLTGWCALAASGWDDHFSRGEAFQRSGQYQLAAAEFEAALHDIQRQNPADTKVSVTWNNLGVVYRALGKSREAESSYQRAIAYYEARPELAGALATSLDNLGALYLTGGRISKAQALYRRSYEIRLRSLPPDDPALAKSLHGLARLAQEQRHPEQAEALYRRALAIEESAYGAASLEIAPTLHNFASVLAESGREDEARALYDRALSIYRERQPGHPGQAVVLRYLAELDARHGLLSQADSRFLQAIGICENTLPQGHTQTGIILQAYGRFLKQAHRKTEASVVMASANRIIGASLRDSGAAYTVDVSAFQAK